MTSALKLSKTQVIKKAAICLATFLLAFSVVPAVYALDPTPSPSPTTTTTPSPSPTTTTEDKDKETDKGKEYVQSGIGSITVTPRIDQANKLMSGFQDILGIAVGLLAYIIVIGLPLFSALDIAYITIPVLRNFADEAKSQGKSSMVKSDGKGGSKFRWISDEAVYAVKQGAMDEGKSALTIYFGKRAITYVVCAIVLYLLISGNINVVTNIAVNVVSGIMGVLENLAA